MERALLVALRELVAERRHPDGLVAALTFTGMLVLLESVTFGPGRARAPDIASAMYWIAVLFATVLGADRFIGAHDSAPPYVSPASPRERAEGKLTSM